MEEAESHDYTNIDLALWKNRVNLVRMDNIYNVRSIRGFSTFEGEG